MIKQGLHIMIETYTSSESFYLKCKRSIKWMPASRQCVNRWNDDELRLATGSEKVTHLQHHLDLCSAYFGIPVRCLAILLIFCSNFTL